MSERHDHSRNYIGKVRIELCAKSFILQVYDVLARHRSKHVQWETDDAGDSREVLVQGKECGTML
jgi:hypothetical protein